MSSSPARDYTALDFFPSCSFQGLFPIVLSTILHRKFAISACPRTVEEQLWNTGEYSTGHEPKNNIVSISSIEYNYVHACMFRLQPQAPGDTPLYNLDCSMQLQSSLSSLLICNYWSQTSCAHNCDVGISCELGNTFSYETNSESVFT